MRERLRRALLPRLDGLQALVGIGLIAGGVATVHVGAAMVVTGGILLTLALWPPARRPR